MTTKHYVYPDGIQEWRLNGKLHRDDGGPAFISAEGDQEWFFDGKRHRENAPAIVHVDGNQAWYKHGKLYCDPQNECQSLC